MLFPALRISLAIVLLRAGPQDMPFDATPRLLRETLLFTLVVYTAFWLIEFTLPQAMTAAALLIAAQWLAIRATLSARQLQNRFQQTLTALLLTNSLLMLPMIPFMAKLAPIVKDWIEQLQQHPDLINHTEQLPLTPPLPTLAFYLLSFWQFVVNARIFSRAVDVGVAAGVLIAILVSIATSLFVTFMGPLINFMGS